MKFSVLLPTRNRLEYLKYAISTVRLQDYENWEIIVSDNFSEEDIASYVSSVNDDRVCYIRTDSYIPVTDNWNNALMHSTGDYVVMLGDDDGLMPRYFSTFVELFKAKGNPDFVYTSAYFYAYPGVLPDQPKGFVKRDRSRILEDVQNTSWLSQDTARSIVRGYLDFRMPVASNMQFSLISRKKIEEMSEGWCFFRSPYPDFYATPALFYKSDRILIHPEPMVIVGITPKSYGFYHFNNRAAEGKSFLRNDVTPTEEWLRAIVLPGTSYNDSWLLANEALKRVSGIRPNYRRYRFLQIVHGYKRYFFDRQFDRDGHRLLKEGMTLYERVVLGTVLTVGFMLLRRIPARVRVRAVIVLRRVLGQHAMPAESAVDGTFSNLLELFLALDSNSTKRVDWN